MSDVTALDVADAVHPFAAEIKRMSSEIESLRAERDALLPDAMRYRFIRTENARDDDADSLAVVMDGYFDQTWIGCDLDDAIDGYMREAGYMPAPQANEQEQADER